MPFVQDTDHSPSLLLNISLWNCLGSQQVPSILQDHIAVICTTPHCSLDRSPFLQMLWARCESLLWRLNATCELLGQVWLRPKLKPTEGLIGWQEKSHDISLARSRERWSPVRRKKQERRWIPMGCQGETPQSSFRSENKASRDGGHHGL